MVLAFQILSAVFLTIFFYYGYDMKRRDNWKTLAPNRSIILMKLMAVVLGLILYSSILVIKTVNATDFIALAFFVLGALLVRSAKRELEKNQAFTWTGYALEKPNLVTSGVYAFIRHPLYTGVYLTEIGGVLVVIRRTTEWFPEQALIINSLLIAGLTYAMFFNSLLARKESQNLETLFGRSYKIYSQKVHPFIPFMNKWSVKNKVDI
jgi:protein-S-isoprenylcysteine O-methyltransferase Ste14